MTSTTTFSTQFQITQKSTCKTSIYSDLRKEIGQTFNISLAEVNFLLPKKATAHELKLSNGITAYSLDNSPILFFRRESPDFTSSSSTSQSQKQQKVQSNVKNKKSTNNTNPYQDTLLIPTIFALWKVPSLLPPSYIFDDIYDKITSVKPTTLFTPGIVMPDLPDAFLLQASTHPQHFLNLLPNQLTNDTIPSADEDEDPLLQSPETTKTYQQSTFPLFHHNKSFDFILRPSQLRAIYTKSSPYCIGVGYVDKSYNPVETYTNALATQKKNAGYLTPWVESNSLPKDLVEMYYNKVETSENDDLIEKTITDLTIWPRDMIPYQQSTQYDNNTASSIHLNVSVASSIISHPQSSFQSTLSTIQALNNVANSLSNTSSPMSTLLNFLKTPQSLSTLFPTTGASIPLILQQLQCPTLAQSVTPSHSADTTLLTSLTSMNDRRPYPSGHSLTILHCMNDTLSDTYRTFYPTEGFEWISMDKATIKPHPKFITLSRTINLILRVAWLACCCKPSISIAMKTTQDNNNDEKDDAEEEEEEEEETVSTQPKNFVITDNDKITQYASGLDLPRGTDAEIDDHSSNEGNYDDEDYDEDYDEDDDEIDGDDEIDSKPQQGICIACHSARFEWAFQYTVQNCITEYPAQLSDVSKYLRACSYAPSCLQHIHSRQYAESIHQMQKGNKALVPTIFCTCTPCTNSQTNTSNPSSIDFQDIITHCRCVNAMPLDLMMNNENKSKYTKLATLVKHSEKADWVKTKVIKQQQVLAGPGISNIKVIGLDKLAIITKLENPTATPTVPAQNQTQPTATVQVIQAVKFKPRMRELLDNVASYSRFSKLIQGKQPLNTSSPLEVISFYAHTLLELHNGYAPYIIAAVREYININDLTVVTRGNLIVKKSQNPHAILPLAVQTLLQKSHPQSNQTPSNPNSWSAKTAQNVSKLQGNQQNNSTSDHQQKSINVNNNSAEKKGTDAFPEDDSDDYSDNDLFTAGGNTKKSHEEVKREQAAIKKQQNQAKQNEKKLLDAQKNQKNNKKQQNSYVNSDKTVVHLCYQKVLFDALDLQSDKSYTMDNIENIVKSQLIPTKSLSTSDLFTIHQLYTNFDLIQYLFEIYQNPEKEAQYHKSYPGTTSIGLQQIAAARIGLGGIDIPRLFSFGTSKLSFKQTTDSGASLGSKQAATNINASSSQPAILLFSTTYRNKDLTLCVGFELFGIQPKDVIKAQGFSSYMACATKLLDTTVEGSDFAVRRLFPRSINEKCRHLIKLQGNQVQKVTQYCIDTLHIHSSNIFDLTQGKKNK